MTPSGHSAIRPTRLRGGNPADLGAPSQESYLLAYVNKGYTVVVPDYEGIQLAWGAGQESGYATLDGITAAGTSSGSPPDHAGRAGGLLGRLDRDRLRDRARALLRLGPASSRRRRGGSYPLKIRTGLAYTNGSQQRAGVMPAVVVGFARAFNLDPAQFETPYALSISQQVSNQCFYNFYQKYPNLTIQQMVKAPYHDLYSVPLFARINNTQIMSRAGTPREPVLIVVGNSDGIGDGLVVVADDAALVPRRTASAGFGSSSGSTRGRPHPAESRLRLTRSRT